MSCARNLVADHEEQLKVFDGAAQIPISLHFIGRFVVVVVRVFGPLLLAVAGWLADVIHSRIRIKGGHTLLGEFEMVGAVEESLFGLRVGDDGA